MQRDRDADRPVAAHAQVARVVEEDHPGGAGRVGRLAQERPDQSVPAARLVDHRLPEVVGVPQPLQPLVEAAAAQVRSAGDDHPSGLAGGVGVNESHSLGPVQVVFPGQASHQARKVRHWSSRNARCEALSASDPFM